VSIRVHFESHWPRHVIAAGNQWVKNIGHACCILLCTAVLVSCDANREKPGLTFVNGPEPQTLDPALISGQSEGRLAYCLFEGLTRLDENGEVVPGAAAHWDVFPDGKTYTFHLRPNLRWSNGDPLTASDFAASWRRVLEPATRAVYAEVLFVIENAEPYQKGRLRDFNQVGIKVLDASTLQVRLVAPTPYFANLVGFATYLPVPLSVIDKFGNHWTRPEHLVANGAYVLQSWKINDRLEFKANPNYWDAANIKIKRVDALATTQGNTAVNLYFTGQADLILDRGLILPQILPVLKKRRDLHIFNFLGTYFYRFNTSRPPFNNPLVRKAFSAAIDRQSIVDKITLGGEQAASSFVPDLIKGYQPCPGLSYNPEQARAWLAAAGYPDGKGFPRVAIMYNASQQHVSVAVEIQAMWKRVLNVDVELRQVEWATYLQALDNLDYDLARSSWVGDYPDPYTFLGCFTTGFGNNRTGWSNSNYDALLQAASRETNPAKRFALLHDAEKILVCDEPPIAPLFFYVGMLLYDPDKFGGLHGTPLDDHPIQDIYRKDAQ
jgi:oligopeptide transport system substrate-binding protein